MMVILAEHGVAQVRIFSSTAAEGIGVVDVLAGHWTRRSLSRQSQLFSTVLSTAYLVFHWKNILAYIEGGCLFLMFILKCSTIMRI